MDSVFSVLSHSVVDGPLKKVRNDGGLGGACCHTVKASDANGDDPKRVICLYFDSCWNEKHAKKVNPLEKRIDIVSKRSLGTN